MDFYDKYKEWIDQPLHVLMGAVLTFVVAVGLSYVGVPLWGCLIAGVVVSRIVWMIREWWQHRKHGHEPRYWWSFDLLFIDIGVAIGATGASFLIWL